MKYSVDSLQPKLEQFLGPLLSQSGFELSYRLAEGKSAHPEVENPEVTVHFSGEDTDLLLANRAELLLALEHLTMEALRIPPEDHSLVSFDANDYRLLRIEELRMSAKAAAEKVKKTHVPFHFNPMTSRERRVIHLALREEKELRSESVGMGMSRAVVIVPADMPTPPAPPRPFYRGPREGAGGDRGHRDSRDRGRGQGSRPFRRDRNPRP
jgi:spoIIIJ-associated protein